MLTVLRTAFLIYVRVLLCVQGLFLALATWALWPRPIAFLFALPALVSIAAALLLRRGRRWAAIVAILIEVLWTLIGAALAYKTLKDWPLDLQALEKLTVLTLLFLIAVVGFTLRPIRAYAGLVRP